MDLGLGNGRTLHVYDTGTGDAGDRLAVFWHQGTPNIGAPPEPLFAAAEDLGIRWLSYDRPGYGGSTSDPGRNLASAAGIGPSQARTANGSHTAAPRRNCACTRTKDTSRSSNRAWWPWSGSGGRRTALELLEISGYR